MNRAMIRSECFSEPYIALKAKELRPVDPLLLEKAIHALALVGYLVESGLPFVFKGGTCLLLFMQPIRRLSIDVDILCGESDARVDEILKSIAAKPPFTGHAPDERGERGLPRRRHFRFTYRSIQPRSLSQHILLDIVVEPRCVLPTMRRPVQAPFLTVEGETQVEVPTPEGLLADKLTAFAPHTIGVPLRHPDGTPGQTMQVAKQLFDVGELFDLAGDLAAISSAYDGVAAQESSYRPRMPPLTREEALRDTIQACEQVAVSGLKGFAPNPDAELLLEGAGKLKCHLVNARFGLDELRLAAGKTAFLAGLLLRGTPGSLADHRYTEERFARVEHAPITGPLAGLNKLKKSNPAAGYYWHGAASRQP